MKLVRMFTIVAALSAGATAFADTPAKAPADKKAPATDKAPAPAPAKTELTEAEAAKFVAFFDKLVDIAVQNKQDCTKMAAGINAHIDANQALLKAAADAKNANKELPKSAKDKIEKRTKDELAPAIMTKCGQDQGVMNAFMRMKPKDAPPPATK